MKLSCTAASFALVAALVSGCGNATSPTPADSDDDSGTDAGPTGTTTTSPPKGGGNDAGTDTGPTTPVSGSDTCTTNADCGHGEYCDTGVCKIQLCGPASSYSSTPPLGGYQIFSYYRDLVVVDDATASAAGYEPQSLTPRAGESWSAGGTAIVDVAGGNFFGASPEAVALAVSGQSSLTVVQGGTPTSIALPFVPIAVAGGDVDGDGVDEVIALAATGDVAVCHATTGSCAVTSITVSDASLSPKDIAVADVDGDGYAEPIILFNGSGSAIVVWNVDYQMTQEPQTITTSVSETLSAIAAGDINGNGTADVFGLEYGGYLGLESGALHTFTLASAMLEETGSQDVSSDATDVFAGLTNGLTQATVYVLDTNNAVDVYLPSGTDTVALDHTTALGTSQATRLTLADASGNSPSGSLQGGPVLTAGLLEPTSLLVYPPFWWTHSQGTSRISVGSAQVNQTAASTTVGLQASLSIGFEASVPDVVSASLKTKVQASVQNTQTNTDSITVADTYYVDPTAGEVGPDNAAVALANACYHAYTYQIDDPAGLLGGNGTHMVLFVPVGGQTAIWSLTRYNGLAAAEGDLPVLQVPSSVGDATTYPSTLQTLEGQPIAPADLVLSVAQSYSTSDVAQVGWSLTMGTSVTNTMAATTTLSAISDVSVGPVDVTGQIDGITGTAYAVTIGSQASFGGWVPPVSDQSQYGFSFAPFVYREHYTDAKGNDAGLYVVNYTVGP